MFYNICCTIQERKTTFTPHQTIRQHFQRNCSISIREKKIFQTVFSTGLWKSSCGDLHLLCLTLLQHLGAGPSIPSGQPVADVTQPKLRMFIQFLYTCTTQYGHNRITIIISLYFHLIWLYFVKCEGKIDLMKLRITSQIWCGSNCSVSYCLCV